MNTAYSMGLRIVATPFAREVRTEWKVAPWPIRKRRKSWRVQRIDINRPGAYQMGGTLFVHPDLMPKLEQELREAGR